MPAYPPIQWTVICWMLTEHYFEPGSFEAVLTSVWVIILWLGFGICKMIEYPVDVFENFRKLPEDTEKEDT